jgi:hypothetical protein
MADLNHQIRAYAEHLDAITPSVEELARRVGDTIDEFVPTTPRWRPAVLAAAGFAVFVLVVVGGVALLTRTAPEVAAPSTTTAAPPTTTTEPDASPFSVASETPAFPTGPAGSWDHPFVGPGAVVFVDGQFHMLRHGYGEDSPTRVGYGVSADGIDWSAVSADPVLTLEGLTAARVHSGLVDAEGTWVLYFEQGIGEADEKVGKEIGTATAPAPEGPWSVDPSPVLVPGDGWNALGVGQPSVLATTDGYVMYFAAVGDDEVGRIGRAVSTDRVTWAADPDPVLIPTAEWERGSVRRPEVVATGDGLVMLYANSSAGNWGIATSRDGVTWTKSAANPVLSTSDVPRAQIRNAELVLIDGTYYLYLETGGARSTTDIAVLQRLEEIPID